MISQGLVQFKAERNGIQTFGPPLHISSSIVLQSVMFMVSLKYLKPFIWIGMHLRETKKTFQRFTKVIQNSYALIYAMFC